MSTYKYVVMHIYRDLLDEKDDSPEVRRAVRKRPWLVLAEPHRDGRSLGFYETAAQCATEWSANHRMAYLRERSA